MYDLKPTQIEVLKVLAKFPDTRMGSSDIEKYCSVKRALISNALNVLAKKDLVYQPDIYDKVQISGDGLSAAREYGKKLNHHRLEAGGFGLAAKAA